MPEEAKTTRPFVIPDPKCLPDWPTVTLTEAISWLVTGDALTREVFCLTNVSELSSPLLQLLYDGQIKAFGRKEFADGWANSPEEPIPHEVFQSAVHFRWHLDCLEAHASDGHRSFVAAREAGTWEDVRFDRADIIRHRRILTGGDSTHSADSEKGKSKGGRPVKNMPVLDAFDHLAPGGKTPDTTWRVLAMRVSKIVGWKISSEALEAAVRKRNNATKPPKPIS